MELFVRLVDWFASLFEHTYTRQVALKFLDLSAQLLPYVLIGLVLVALLKTLFPREKMAGRLRGNSFFALLLAGTLGAVSPIGTYALIPLMASLMRAGTVPVAPLVTFLTASPQINPLLFIMTLGAFGPGMAVMRVVSALTLGLVAGLLARRFVPPAACPAPVESVPTVLNDLTKASSNPPARFVRELLSEGRFVLKIFFLSVLVAALVAALVPADLVARMLGGKGHLPVFLAVLLGIPFYACGGGAIPVLEVLMDLGMSKGAILAFFISGPATKPSVLVALFACMERRVILLYLAVTLAGAFLFGVGYNWCAR